MEQAVKRRIFRSREFWQAEIEKFQSSGQSISDYCRDNGFALSTFTRKVKIFASNKTILAKSSKNKPSFIEVKPAIASTLRLNFPSGISIDIPETYNTSQLNKIIELCRS